MSEPLYACACEQFYYNKHHEECPARRQYEALRERLVELEAKEKQGCVHNDLVYLEEVIARRNEKIVSLEATLASFALVDESRRAEVAERDKQIAALKAEVAALEKEDADKDSGLQNGAAYQVKLSQAVNELTKENATLEAIMVDAKAVIERQRDERLKLEKVAEAAVFVTYGQELFGAKFVDLTNALRRAGYLKEQGE